MTQVQILILDQDQEMGSLLADQIQGPEYRAQAVTTYQQALKELSSQSYSLLIMDSKVPEIATADLLKMAHESTRPARLAILVLIPSVKGVIGEEMIQSGADEFLAKPFDRQTLLAKVKGTLRKIFPESTQNGEITDRFQMGDLTLDLRSFDAFCGDERIHLTPNEFKLLQALMTHPGQVLSRDRLIELVQGEGISVVDRAVDTHIFSLRKKLKTCGDWIETVRGTGYRIKNPSLQTDEP